MRARGWAVAALLAFALFVGMPALAAVYAVRDPGYSCLTSALPAAGISVDPAHSVVGEITLFPVGLRCSIISEAGRATALKPDWILTVLAGVSAGSVLAASLLAVSGLRRR